MRRGVVRTVSVVVVAMGAAACQTVTSAAVQPAVVVEDRDRALETIKRVLGEITGQGRIALGPLDLAQQSVIAVLPAPPGPYEGNSPAMPTYFDLVTDGKGCYLRERGKDELHALPAVGCRPRL